MKVNFTGLNLKSKVEKTKQRQDSEIVKNTQQKWDRKRCNIGMFGLGSALITTFATPTITNQILSKTNTKIHPLSLNARLGMGIMGVGLLVGYLFNKIDEKKNTKLGDFANMLFNGPNVDKK